MAKVGRKKHYYAFDNEFRADLTSRQKMYLDANYGAGVYGRKKYKEVLQELKVIGKGGTIQDVDFLMAKRDFEGDKRIFNNVKLDRSQEILVNDKANAEGEILNSYIPINDDYALAYMTIPGYNGSPIQVTRIISMTDVGDFTYDSE